MASNQGQFRYVPYAVLALTLLPFLAGCASHEHLYGTKDLPSELRASPHLPPYAADLSNSICRTELTAIEPGDTIDIAFVSGPNTERVSRITANVALDGTVMLPTLGQVSLTSVPLQSSSDALIRTSSASTVLSGQSLHVTMRAPRQNRITVLGAIAHPGVYMLPRNESDLVAALAIAGGLNRNAGAKIVIQGARLEGADSTVTETPPTALEPGALKAASGRCNPAAPLRRTIDLTNAPAIHPTELGDGDVVIVEQSEVPSVLVIGTVAKPGRYEFPSDGVFTVLDAISIAQGIPNKVVDTVIVCRNVQDQDEKALIQVSIRAATRNPEDDLLLVSGDIVSVEPTPKSLMKDTGKYVRAGVGCASVLLISR